MSRASRADETTLRSALQSLAARLGKTPTVVEMHEQGDCDPQRYFEVFDGWDEALEAAGLDPGDMGKSIPDRELLAELQRLHTELGKTPTQRDMADHGEYSTRTYQTRFGSWNAAIEQAMLSTNEISEKDLRQELTRLADELDQPPTAEEMEEYGEYAPVTYHRRFGSWRAALAEVDFATNRTKSDVSETELLADVRRLADELGRSPSADDVQARGAYSVREYAERFGSFLAARAQALDDEATDEQTFADDS
ncbi:homing endonuclease associated repeat-containing protein [Halorussus halophilus]|uniref:homing endonuclease associated repeat-containing protein n=1 Tax=Halorussus halophilus TaxID=2650975 RepID=UPI0013011DEA|nr:hypothetical protein [Halorussus halophilus]